MSTDQNKMKEDIRQWFIAWNAHDVKLLDRLADELYAVDCILHDPGITGLPDGLAGVKQFVRGALENTPDITNALDDTVTEGDKIASRFTMSYTERSNGKCMTMQGFGISRYTNGKVVEEWQLTSPPAPIEVN